MAYHKSVVDENKLQLYNLRKERLKKALSEYFNKAIRNGAIVGAGVSVVKGDSIIISGGYGKRKAYGEKEVDGNTVFRLGSLSKGFTGVLAANLKAEGKLAWDDKITDYIPEFRLGTLRNTANVKLEHILSHTTGTPYHTFTNLIEEGWSMDLIAKRFKQVRPLSQPGKEYSYQNAMFALSQAVVQKSTGKKIETLLEERFFKPLGMNNMSTNHIDLLNTENKALPSVRRKRGWQRKPLTERYYNAIAAGGVNASAEDMAKWMRFLLGYNPEVMKAKDFKEVFNPYVSFKNNRKYYQKWQGHLKSSYGFGWRIHELQETDNKKITIWHHGGSVNNFRNEIAIYPDVDLGICVLLNSQSKITKTLVPDLYNLVKEIYVDIPENLNNIDIVDVSFENN